jgi:hypothetical protein
MAVADVKSSKREVKCDRRVEQITEWNGEHANSMEWHDTARWQFVLLQLRRAGKIAFYQLRNLTVS